MYPSIYDANNCHAASRAPHIRLQRLRNSKAAQKRRTHFLLLPSAFCRLPRSDGGTGVSSRIRRVLRPRRFAAEQLTFSAAPIVDTVCTVVGYAVSGVRPSVCLSVPSIDRCSSVRRVCCWAPRGQEISIDSDGRQAATAHSSTAFGSKCEQCRVDSRRKRLNVDVLLVFVDCCTTVRTSQHDKAAHKR